MLKVHHQEELLHDRVAQRDLESVVASDAVEDRRKTANGLNIRIQRNE